MPGRQLILRIIVIFLLIYSMSIFSAGLLRLGRARQELERSAEYLQSLEEENRRLKEELGSVPDDREMEELARDRLGMVFPGEKIFIFDSDREEPVWGPR